jgi:hypothetical protein
MDHRTVPEWARDVSHPEKASAARVYDYLLGGTHHLEADRLVGAAMQQAKPAVPLQMLTNRAFLGRAVRFMVDAGIRQFLDIGSGIPTVGNVHEIAKTRSSGCRVVYIDCDPVAVMQSLQLLAEARFATALEGDLTDPEGILAELATPELRKLIDPHEPVGLLLIAVTHFVSDEENLHDHLATLREWLPPGSFMALSQGAVESYKPEEIAQIRAAYAGQRAAIPTARTWEQTRLFFDGLVLQDPGLVYLPQWRPEPGDPAFFNDDPRRSGSHAGVGLKIG